MAPLVARSIPAAHPATAHQSALDLSGSHFSSRQTVFMIACLFMHVLRLIVSVGCCSGGCTTWPGLACPTCSHIYTAQFKLRCQYFRYKKGWSSCPRATQSMQGCAVLWSGAACGRSNAASQLVKEKRVQIKTLRRNKGEHAVSGGCIIHKRFLDRLWRKAMVRVR